MLVRVKRKVAGFIGLASAGLMFQSGCPLAENFDPLTLFAQVSSTLIGDTIFFALDSFLVSIS